MIGLTLSIDESQWRRSKRYRWSGISDCTTDFNLNYDSARQIMNIENQSDRGIVLPRRTTSHKAVTHLSKVHIFIAADQYFVRTDRIETIFYGKDEASVDTLRARNSA